MCYLAYIVTSWPYVRSRRLSQAALPGHCKAPCGYAPSSHQLDGFLDIVAQHGCLDSDRKMWGLGIQQGFGVVVCQKLGITARLMWQRSSESKTPKGERCADPGDRTSNHGMTLQRISGSPSTETFLTQDVPQAYLAGNMSADKETLYDKALKVYIWDQSNDSFICSPHLKLSADGWKSGIQVSNTRSIGFVSHQVARPAQSGHSKRRGQVVKSLELAVFSLWACFQDFGSAACLALE